MNLKEIKTNLVELYSGMYDINDKGKKLTIITQKEKINIDINKVITIGNPSINNLTIENLKYLLNKHKLEANILPNGNTYLTKIEENKLKDCYISVFEDNQNKYLICIAFGEIQPTLYKAELMSIYKINTE